MNKTKYTGKFAKVSGSPNNISYVYVCDHDYTKKCKCLYEENGSFRFPVEMFFFIFHVISVNPNGGKEIKILVILNGIPKIGYIHVGLPYFTQNIKIYE